LETNQKSVFGAVQFLGSRLSLLEPSHLDHVEGRLAALHQKMNAIADKKQVSCWLFFKSTFRKQNFLKAL
jgi:hypothetical protein